jgi:hypothetical protein
MVVRRAVHWFGLPMEGLLILLLPLFVLMEGRSMGGYPLFLAAAVVGQLVAADLPLGCRHVQAAVLRADASRLRPLLSEEAARG